MVLVGCAGCGEPDKDMAPPAREVTLPDRIKVEQPVTPGERFVPTNSGDLAYDTKTGSLCKTWNWGKAQSYPAEQTIGARTTTCSSLYEEDRQFEREADRARDDLRRFEIEHAGKTEKAK